MKRLIISLIFILCLGSMAHAATPTAKTDTLATTFDGITTTVTAFVSGWNLSMASGTIDTLTAAGYGRNLQIINGGTTGDTVFVSLSQTLYSGRIATANYPIIVIAGATQLITFPQAFIKRVIVKSSTSFKATIEVY